MSDWWETAPTVATSAATASAPSPKGGNWWESAKDVQEMRAGPGPKGGWGNMTPADDVSKSARSSAVLEASLHPDVDKQIQVYAKARGIDPKRYGVDKDGNIVFMDPNNNDRITREVPSIGGSTGIGDFFKRIGLGGMSMVGPSVPQVAAGTVATAMGPTGMSIPAAAATAGVVDQGRQMLGNLISGFDVLDTNLASSGGQALMAGIPQAATVGINKAVTRNPLGAGTGDLSVLKDPAKYSQFQQTDDLMRSQGISATPAEITNARSLLARQRQLGRFDETATTMDDFYRMRNETQIPNAFNRTMDQISPEASAAQGARRLQGAASEMVSGEQAALAAPIEAAQAGIRERLQSTIKNVFGGDNFYAEDARLIANLQSNANEAYSAARKATPQVWSKQLADMFDRPTMKQALGSAQLNAADQGKAFGIVRGEGGKFAVGDGFDKSSPIQALSLEAADDVKKALDNIIEETGKNQFTGKLNNRGRIVTDLKNQFLSAVEDADQSGLYKKARQIYAGDFEAANALRLGREFDQYDPEEITQMLSKMSEGERRAYKIGAGRQLQDKMDKTKDGSDVANILFGNEAMRKKVSAALGDDEFRVVSGAFEAERKLFSRAPEIGQLESSIIGTAAKDRASGLQNVPKTMFDISKADPISTATARSGFEKAGKLDDWNAGLRAYLTDTFASSQKNQNIAGSYYRAIAGDPRQAATLKAAMSPEQHAVFKDFTEALNVVRRALPEGSPTATDLGGKEAFAGAAARTIGRAPKLLSPQNLGENISEFVLSRSASKNAEIIANIITQPGAIAELKKLRALSPTSQKALTIMDDVIANYGIIATGAGRPSEQMPAAYRE